MEKIKHIRLGSLTLLAFFLFFFSLNGSADAWYDNNWLTRINITVDVGSNVTDFVIPINVTHGTGMHAQCNDCRFTDADDNLLDSWQYDDLSIDGEYHYLYVSGNFTTQNGTQLRLYYNNSGASSYFNFTDTFYGADGSFSTTDGWTETDPLGRIEIIGGELGNTAIFTNFPDYQYGYIIADLGIGNNYTASDFILDYEFMFLELASYRYLIVGVADTNSEWEPFITNPVNAYGAGMGSSTTYSPYAERVTATDVAMGDANNYGGFGTGTTFYIRAKRLGTDFNVSMYANATYRSLEQNPLSSNIVTGGPSGSLRYLHGLTFAHFQALGGGSLNNTGWVDNIILRSLDSDMSTSNSAEENYPQPTPKRMSSISGMISFVVVDTGYVEPSLTTHWLYNQDGDVWYVYPNGSITCEFTPYSPNESAIMYAFVSWYVNGTNSTGNYSQFEVTNGMVTTVTLGPGELSQDEEWDCVVLVNDTYSYSPEYTTSPRYSMYVVPYSTPIAPGGSVHLAIFVLFMAVALICVVLDVFADIPYLGVFGGIMFILMGTLMAFDVPQVYRTFCEPQYNQTGIMCINKIVVMEPTMNAGMSAMLWIVGLGLILEAIYFRVNEVKREEV